MDPTGAIGPFTPNREVDELRWCSPSEAARLLTYEHDRMLLERLEGTRPVTAYLVRHTKAGSRQDWDGPDELRPLSKAGKRQAAELADRLAERGIVTIVSSPYLRCRQTVEPLAERLHLSVEIADELAEGASLDQARRILDKVDTAEAVVCSHGDVIGALLRDAQHHGVHLDDDRLEKGSAWAVELEAGAIIAAEYLPAPNA
jgi:8-oxo-dGTP diphosphatase